MNPYQSTLPVSSGLPQASLQLAAVPHCMSHSTHLCHFGFGSMKQLSSPHCLSGLGKECPFPFGLSFNQQRFCSESAAHLFSPFPWVISTLIHLKDFLIVQIKSWLLLKARRPRILRETHPSSSDKMPGAGGTLCDLART